MCEILWRVFFILTKMGFERNFMSFPELFGQLHGPITIVSFTMETNSDLINLILTGGGGQNGGSGQNVDRFRVRKTSQKMRFCPFSFKFGDFDRVPETL